MLDFLIASLAVNNFRTRMSGKDVHERLHLKPMKNGLCWISFEKERLTTEFQNKRLPSPKRDESLNLPRYHSHSDVWLQTLHFSSLNGDEPLSPTQNHVSAFLQRQSSKVCSIHPLPSRTIRRLSENKIACTIPFLRIFIYILLYQKNGICQEFVTETCLQ